MLSVILNITTYILLVMAVILTLYEVLSEYVFCYIVFNEEKTKASMLPLILLACAVVAKCFAG